MSAPVFITHSSRDYKRSRAVVDVLEKKGLRCWISERDIGAGDNYGDAIVDAIENAKVMVLVFSANANSSDEIKKEIALASQRKLTVVPIRIEDAAPSKAFLYELITRNWIDCFPDWHRGMETLVQRVSSIVNEMPASGQTPGVLPKPKGTVPVGWIAAGVAGAFIIGGAAAYGLWPRPAPVTIAHSDGHNLGIPAMTPKRVADTSGDQVPPRVPIVPEKPAADSASPPPSSAPDISPKTAPTTSMAASKPTAAPTLPASEEASKPASTPSEPATAPASVAKSRPAAAEADAAPKPAPAVAKPAAVAPETPPSFAPDVSPKSPPTAPVSEEASKPASTPSEPATAPASVAKSRPAAAEADAASKPAPAVAKPVAVAPETPPSSAPDVSPKSLPTAPAPEEASKPASAPSEPATAPASLAKSGAAAAEADAASKPAAAIAKSAAVVSETPPSSAPDVSPKSVPTAPAAEEASKPAPAPSEPATAPASIAKPKPGSQKPASVMPSKKTQVAALGPVVPVQTIAPPAHPQIPAIGSKPPPYKAATHGGEVFAECKDCPQMVVVPRGTAILGSPQGQPGRNSNEASPHSVTIGKPFAMGRYAVTFDEWDACVADGGCNGYKPDDNGFGRGRHPVIFVSWNDANAYVAWLKKKTGQPYRLPSESEWEYAARGCTDTQCPDTPFWFGDISPDLANYDSRYSYEGSPKAERELETVPVDQGKPNPFGLYNMLGNVQQWVEDCWNPDPSSAAADDSPLLTGDCGDRVIRGGSYSDKPGGLRAAARAWDAADDRESPNIGFRIVRTLAP